MTTEATTIVPIGMQIEYLGAKRPKVVELPIPLEQKCLKTGEVICDPIGIFPVEAGQTLLSLAGDDGLYRFVAYVYPDGMGTSDVTLSCPRCGKLAKSAFGLRAHQRACMPPSPETPEGGEGPSPDEGRPQLEE